MITTFTTTGVLKFQNNLEFNTKTVDMLIVCIQNTF